MGDLFDAIKATSKNGKLDMFGTEWTMVLTNAIGELMVRLDTKEERRKVYESGKASALDAIESGFGGAWMPKVLRDLGVRVASKLSKKDFLVGNIKMWSLLGWGDFKIVRMGDDEAVLTIENSPIAKYVLDKHGKQKHNVCNWILGEFAGGYSYLCGKDMDGEETKCMAKGDPYCELIVRSVK